MAAIPETVPPPSPGLSGRRWWLACGLVLIGSLLATVPTAGDIGLTWDEPSYRTSQVISAQWWEALFKARSLADVRALVEPDALLVYWPYARFGYNFHPPLAGQLDLLTHALFGRWMKDITSRRLASVFEYAATITLLFGFLARRYGAWVGGVAAGALLLHGGAVGTLEGGSASTGTSSGTSSTGTATSTTTPDLDTATAVFLGSRSRLFGLAYRMLGTVAEAEDVVQEALTSLLAQTPPPRDPVAWMYRAVRNAAIDQSRATSRRRRREQTVAESRREWFEPSADALMRKLRTLLTVYRETGGAKPIILFHDDAHGTPMIDALARYGDSAALPSPENDPREEAAE